MDSQITLLGACSLRDRAGLPLRLPTRKSCALLAYLALSDGRAISRDELATLLWPRGDDGQSRASLRQELAVLRKAMAPSGLPVPESTLDAVQLTLPAEMVDVLQFEELSVEGSYTSLRQAVGLYRGEFLGGLNVSADPFEDWVWVERSRLRTLAQNIYLRLLDMEAAGGDPETAIDTANALLRIDPTQEKAHRALMRLYQASGRRSQALNQYQSCVEILRRELDTEPSEETVALAKRLRSGRPVPQSQGAAVPQVEALMSAPRLAATHDMIVLVLNLADVAAMRPRLEPQDLAQMQDRLLRRSGRVMAVQGGHIIPGPGDRVTACFHTNGDPDDIRRAMQAAQTIVARPISVYPAPEAWPRAGMARGSVLLRSDPLGLATADMTGLARLEASEFAQLARGGEVVISTEIRELMGDSMYTSIVPASADTTTRRDGGHVLRELPSGG